MNILLTAKLQLVDPTLPIPQYQTGRSVGVDLYARLTTTLPPHQVTKIPLNVAIELPEGYWGMVSARSSLHKRGLMLANGIGVVDPDFAGSGDEYQAILYNYTDTDVVVEKGERIVQLVLLPATQMSFALTELSNTNRGGLGSTGTHV